MVRYSIHNKHRGQTSACARTRRHPYIEKTTRNSVFLRSFSKKYKDNYENVNLI